MGMQESLAFLQNKTLNIIQYILYTVYPPYILLPVVCRVHLIEGQVRGIIYSTVYVLRRFLESLHNLPESP